MGKYILRRLLYILPVLFFMSIIVFSFIHLIPGDPVDVILGMRSNVESRAILREQLGLDKSIITQYITWLVRAVRGDLGRSIFTNRPIMPEILMKLPATLLLSFASLVFTVLVAIPLGTLAALKRNSIFDTLAMTMALLATSIPSFWLGIMLILALGVYANLLPTIGYVSPLVNPMGTLKHLILPTLTLGASMIGTITRVTRSQVLDTLGNDYTRTARAKGLTEQIVVFKHVLRNSLIPTITVLGIQLGWMLGSAMVVEEIFALPGVGRLGIQAIYGRDYPMVQGVVLVIAFLFVLINLVVDVIYSFLDPRIRFK